MTSRLSKHDLMVIYKSLQWAVWCAGEGICDGDDRVESAEDFLFEFSCHTEGEYNWASGKDDWDAIPGRIFRKLTEKGEGDVQLPLPLGPVRGERPGDKMDTV